MGTTINKGKKERRQRLESRAIKKDREDAKSADAMKLLKEKGTIDKTIAQKSAESQERQSTARNQTALRQQNMANKNALNVQGLRNESASSIVDKNIAGASALQDKKSNTSLKLESLSNLGQQSRQREKSASDLAQATQVQDSRNAGARSVQRIRNKGAMNIAKATNQPYQYTPSQTSIGIGGKSTTIPGRVFDQRTGQIKNDYSNLTDEQLKKLQQQGLR